MIKVAALVLDFYDDAKGEIARTLPEEYHQLKIASPDEVEDLRDSQFALVMKTAEGRVFRKFPIHNEDNLKLSEAYLHKTWDRLPEEAAKMAQAKILAAKNGDAANDTGYVDLAKVAQRSYTFDEKVWGLTLDGRNRYPLHNEELVKTAVARFQNTTSGMKPEHKFMYARNIEKRAEALGVDIPTQSKVHLYTNGSLNLESLKDAIEQRKMAVASRSDIGTEILDQLATAAGCRVDQGSIESDDSFAMRSMKVASVRKLNPPHIIAALEQFDKLAGFTNYHYAKGLPDPFASCFKQASFHNDGSLIVDGVDLGKLDPNDLSDKFSDDFIQEFQSDPANVYKSLPDPIKQLIRGLAENRMANPTNTKIDPESDSTPVAGGYPHDRLNPRFADPITRDSL